MPVTTIFNVRQSYCARYSYMLSVRPSVRPSVCLSVTRWHCVETAQPIVKLSSLPGSPMILVFWGPNLSPEFQWEHPNGGVKCKGVGKSCNFRPISRYSSLKRDGYMLPCVWRALNSLSTHVTFTAIVPGRTQGRPKCAETDARSIGNSHPSCHKCDKRTHRQVQNAHYMQDVSNCIYMVFAQMSLTGLQLSPVPLSELTAWVNGPRVDGWPVSITRQQGPCWRARVSTSRVDWQCWRPVNSASGNRA